jgi:hypothetical protein
MDARQIEELKAWATPQRASNQYTSHVETLASIGGPPEVRANVARLLEEREALLAALRVGVLLLNDERDKTMLLSAIVEAEKP